MNSKTVFIYLLGVVSVVLPLIVFSYLESKNTKPCNSLILKEVSNTLDSIKCPDSINIEIYKDSVKSHLLISSKNE